MLGPKLLLVETSHPIRYRCPQLEMRPSERDEGDPRRSDRNTLLCQHRARSWRNVSNEVVTLKCCTPSPHLTEREKSPGLLSLMRIKKAPSCLLLSSFSASARVIRLIYLWEEVRNIRHVSNPESLPGTRESQWVGHLAGFIWPDTSCSDVAPTPESCVDV